MTKIAVLASHNGSGFDTLYKNAKELNISIELLISNNSNSLAIENAKKRGIESYVINSKTASDPDQKVYELIKAKNCSIVYLSGYMKKISSDITGNFKVINSHPSLLPKYGGKGMYGHHVHEAVIQNKESQSGCTLHYVNEVYDDGEIILQNKIVLDENETAKSLEKKIKILEGKTIVEGLKMFELAEYIGIVAFAMSGFFIATRAKLDLLGVLISTFLTALGGGIIRDISVGTKPFTFSHDYPGIIVLSVMIIMILFKFHKRNSIENKSYFIFSDSIGLISFSISGALIALEYDLNFTGVLAISFITAVGGGIVRDVIINEIPFVFKTGFYGTVALLMATCVYALNMLGLVNFMSLTILFILGVALRLVAFYKKWSIPLK